MCECGCGELNGLVKLPAKGGWYVIEVYPGCANCGSSYMALGVTFLKESDEDTEYLVEDVPTAQFDDRSQWGKIILDGKKLTQRILKEAENGDDPDGATAYAMEEFFTRDGLREVVRESLHANEVPKDG